MSNWICFTCCISQVVYQVPEKYIESHSQINQRMRAILVDWLVQVHDKFRLLQETLFLTVSILDRYLAVSATLSFSRMKDVPSHKSIHLEITFSLVTCCGIKTSHRRQKNTSPSDTSKIKSVVQNWRGGNSQSRYIKIPIFAFCCILQSIWTYANDNVFDSQIPEQPVL